MRVSEVKKPAQELLQNPHHHHHLLLLLLLILLHMEHMAAVFVIDVVTVVAIAKVYEKKTAPHEIELHKLFKGVQVLAITTNLNQKKPSN
jgi:hypothetical protein